LQAPERPALRGGFQRTDALQTRDGRQGVRGRLIENFLIFW